jgi:hypothetical protein
MRKTNKATLELSSPVHVNMRKIAIPVLIVLVLLKANHHIFWRTFTLHKSHAAPRVNEILLRAKMRSFFENKH